jgi:hypothetical protein
LGAADTRTPDDPQFARVCHLRGRVRGRITPWEGRAPTGARGQRLLGSLLGS